MAGLEGFASALAGGKIGPSIANAAIMEEEQEGPLYPDLAEGGTITHTPQSEVYGEYKTAEAEFKEENRLEVAWDKNIVSAFNRVSSDINNEPDNDWIATGRDSWLKENEEYMSPEMKESIYEGIEEGDFDNHEKIMAYVTNHAREEMAMKRMYEGGALGFTIGLGTDLLTGLVQPVDLALTLATLGTYKYAQVGNAAAKGWNAYQKLGAAGASAAAFSVASEESRQYLGGFDMNNETETALFGAVLGTSFNGIGQVWGRMSPKDQANTLKAVHNNYENNFKFTEAPIAKDSDVTGIPKPKGVNVNWNPSPLVRTYGRGKDYLYEYANKVAPSFVTLYDDAGKAVAQKQGTAWEKTSIWTDSHHKTYATKIQSLQAESKMKTEDFNIEVSNAARLQAEEHKALYFKTKVLNEKIAKTTDEASLIKLKQELKDVQQHTPKDIEHANPSVTKAVKLTQNFYKDYNGKRLELDKAAVKRKEKNADKLVEKEAKLDADYKDRHLSYFTRYWSPDAISENVDVSIELITEGMMKSKELEAYRLYDTETYEQMIKDIPEMAKSMVYGIKENIDGSKLQDSTLRKYAKPDVLQATSMKARKLDVDDNVVAGLLRSDISEVTHAYSHDMGHKLGVKEAFEVSSLKEFEETVLTPLKTKIAKDKTLDSSDVSRIINDIDTLTETMLGTREIVSNPRGSMQTFKRAIMNGNNALYSAGFGELVLAEIGTTWKVGGMDAIKSIGPAIKKVVKDYRKKGYSTEDIENIQDALDGIPLSTSIVHSNIERRMGDGSLYKFQEKDVSSKAVEGLGKIANVGFHIGGMNFMTTSLQYAAAMGIRKRIERLGDKLSEGGKLSKSELGFFSRMGLDENDFLEIAKQPRKDKDGNYNSVMEGWSEEVKERVISAQWRGAKEAVIMESPYALPNVMTSTNDVVNSIVNIVSQYTKHPIMSYNYLLKNGLNDRDARSVAAAGFSFSLLATSLYIREQIFMELGILDSTDAKYDLDDDEGIEALAYDVISKVPQFSYIPRVMEFGAANTNMEIPGNTFQQDPVSSVIGPVGGLVKKVTDVTKGVGMAIEDEELDPIVGPTLKLVPVLNSFPMTEEPIKKFIDDY